MLQHPWQSLFALSQNGNITVGNLGPDGLINVIPRLAANSGTTNAVSEEHRLSLELKAKRKLSRQRQPPRVPRNLGVKRRLVYPRPSVADQVDAEMVDAETE